ncbi:amino acid ABC transporter membrane protein 2 (PAAT family) [Dongia mobilis]|uniref:Amino acid ABC transporter membrane protein 2 (PAAT family) n=1 Tax=Dongia mobilis TaxID=578943 RepID=A0A4R6WN87_9PROT|nr:amino acid ABC transporter permease [Dongia mobilis]TDQ77599.1 amino acid ABC transporter membrane protein 2 (PAAT family) [Dongia mobilis]
MSDTSMEKVIPGNRPSLPPPVTESGVLGWMRHNLFSNWWDTLLTLAAIYILYLVIPPFLNWAVFDAIWQFSPEVVQDGKQPQFADCTAISSGACWIFVRARFWQFIFGFYPDEERWRVVLTFILLVGSVYGLLSQRVANKKPVAIFFFVIFPFLAFFLLHGGLGLPEVPTSRWGGIMLTLIIAGIGILFSLPLGILLALGRRSQLPIVHLLCVLFIEFARGVPLVTILFMANIMLPLFLPPQFEPDILLRILVGVTMFASAYMAEVIRGGLQALPKGQYEGAMAMGLGYWQMMRLVIMPQALRVAIPGIVNNFISLTQDTTLVAIVGLYDFLNIVRAGSRDSNWIGTEMEGYVFCAFVYWVFCFAMSRYSMHIERKLHTGHKRH